MDQVADGLYVDKMTERQSSCYQVTAAVTVTQLCRASVKRVRLEIWSDGNTTINLGTKNTFDQQSFVQLPTGTFNHVIMDYDTHGTLLQQPWFVFAAAGTPIVSVIETVEY